MTVANPRDFEFETGLEDFDMEDAVIPRIKIVHKQALFKDSLSGEEFGTARVILLGLVKQRILWHTQLDDGDRPMCRSMNHEVGFPNMSDEQPKEKRFPWTLTPVFDPAKHQPDEDGLIRLDCNICPLKEWKSHPDGKRPYCSEQFTMPVLYNPAWRPGEEDDWDDYVPAIMTFQKTGLKPLKAYLTSFARSRNAAFMAVTEIGLTPLQRGQTDYAVPTFKKVGDTPDDHWREYSTGYRTMKDFLEADPGSQDEAEDAPVKAPSDNVAKPPAQAPAAKEEPVDAEVVEDPPAPTESTPEPEKPVTTAAPAAAVVEDDDLPF